MRSFFAIFVLLLFFIGCSDDTPTTDPGATGGTVSAPVFTPAPGAYAVAQNLTFSSSTPGAVIFYTTDGGTPSVTNGTFYTAPVPVAASMSIKAIAYAGTNMSSVSTGSYSIGGGGGVDVYISGYMWTYLSNSIACYWKNGVRTDLSASDYEYTTKGIAVAGGSVYVLGGRYRDEPYPNSASWINVDGVTTYITDASNTNKVYANDICVDGSDIYVCGEMYSGTEWVPCYWKNGARVDLSSVGMYGVYPRSIYVAGGSVYVAGDYETGTQKIVCYWVNGVRTDLNTDLATYDENRVNDIALKGSDILIAGAMQQSSGSGQAAGYWMNGTRTILQESTTSYPQAIKVFVEGTDVYILGYDYASGDGGVTYTVRVLVWKNGSILHTIPTPLDEGGESGGLYVINGDVHLAISGEKADNTDWAYYWHNGSLQELDIGSNSDLRVTGIFVVPK